LGLWGGLAVVVGFGLGLWGLGLWLGAWFGLVGLVGAWFGACGLGVWLGLDFLGSLGIESSVAGLQRGLCGSSERGWV
jgi:hypothetical protein